MKNQINLFEDFKYKFNTQHIEKKSQLKKLFLSGKFDLDLIKKDKEDNSNVKKEKEKIIFFELSNGEKIKANDLYIKKYSNSVLAAYLNKENNFPKRNGHIFIDRDSQNFKNLLYYLENNKLPLFKTIFEEKNFFSELNYWKIP